MTAPFAQTAIGANPSASTTGLIQRGGRPVASTKRAPPATAARTAARVRGLRVSSSVNRVPSTSHPMSAGAPLLGLAGAVSAFRLLPLLSRLFVLRPLPRSFSQLGDAELPGLVRGRRAATQPSWHPRLALRVRIILLRPIEHRLHRLAQCVVEHLVVVARRQWRSDRGGDRNLAADQLLWVIFGPDPVCT